jgi:hypothetical protein
METQTGIIQVKRLTDNPDGSANLEIETDKEATRYLVEIGLTRLLEMALDKENDAYQIDKDLLKAPEGTRQEETGQGTEALPESDDDDTRGSQ